MFLNIYAEILLYYCYLANYNSPPWEDFPESDFQLDFEFLLQPQFQSYDNVMHVFVITK